MYNVHHLITEVRTSYYMYTTLHVFSELWWDVIVCFVDIGGIFDHHCLKFPFIISLSF
jgi:hypothetical protein